MKVRFTATPDLNTGAITLQTEHSDLFGNFHRSMTVEIMRTKDDAVQQALIALGWTPPGQPPVDPLAPTSRITPRELQDVAHRTVKPGTAAHKAFLQAADYIHHLEQRLYNLTYPIEPNQAAVETALELADHPQNDGARYLIGDKLRPHMMEREDYDVTALRILAAEVRHLRASLKAAPLHPRLHPRAEVFAADPTKNTLESSIRAASNEARQRGIDQEYPTTKPNPPQPGPESELPTPTARHINRIISDALGRGITIKTTTNPHGTTTWSIGAELAPKTDTPPSTGP